jgi:hypothetical protein
LNDFVIEMQTSDIFVLLDNLQVLRDFRHVNPDGDEEAKELQDTNVSITQLIENYPLKTC